MNIQAWGKFFAIDDAGFIVNDCDRNKIQPPWSAPVDELRQRCLDTWPDRLGGLYLRGSVPRGLAVPHLSDLDSFVILSGEIHPADRARSRRIERDIGRRYLFCTKVELEPIDASVFRQARSVWHSIIQLQSLRIAGDRSFPTLPNFRPDATLRNFSQTWEFDLEETCVVLAELSPDRLDFAVRVRQRCAWIARRAVRTGFELVMERDRCYTPDLYHCYRRFAVYFPERRASMRKALELAIAPTTNRAGLILFLRDFGGWLTERVRSIA